MADKIVLNNGREIEGATIAKASWAENVIMISLPGTNLVEMAILFGNPDNTERIDYYHSVVKDSYLGYTLLMDIGYNSSNTGIDVMLKGDESAQMDRGYTIPYNFIPEVIANSTNEKEKNENGPEDDSAGKD